ncbi:MAG TPA: SbmA/BacA-like family transporter [Pirellulales bacterium]
MVFNRQARQWFLEIAKPFFFSEKRAYAFAALALLIVLLFSVNGVNVAASYIQQYFMTALSERRSSDFTYYAFLYVAMFGMATLVAVIYRFTEDTLGLAWRKWLTSHFIERYLSHQAYQKVGQRGDIDNPDQRISEDIRVFTSTTLSFVLIMVNATITICSFAGVLWGITPWLFFAAVGYALFGSLTTLFVGQTLTKLNVLQLKKEADFRYDLVKVRQKADAVDDEPDEVVEKSRLNTSLQAVYNNFTAIIAVNRNLGFFTTGYNYITQILPILIVAPLYMRGEVSFGVVTQATTAFIFALGAFSVFITEFQRISSFSAVVERLGALWEATTPPETPPDDKEKKSDETQPELLLK